MVIAENQFFQLKEILNCEKLEWNKSEKKIPNISDLQNIEEKWIPLSQFSVGSTRDNHIIKRYNSKITVSFFNVLEKSRSFITSYSIIIHPFLIMSNHIHKVKVILIESNSSFCIYSCPNLKIFRKTIKFLGVVCILESNWVSFCINMKVGHGLTFSLQKS